MDHNCIALSVKDRGLCELVMIFDFVVKYFFVTFCQLFISTRDTLFKNVFIKILLTISLYSHIVELVIYKVVLGR